jgi:hypothetical protein
MACKRSLKVPWGRIDYILISLAHLPLTPEMSRMAETRQYWWLPEMSLLAANQPVLGTAEMSLLTGPPDSTGGLPERSGGQVGS